MGEEECGGVRGMDEWRVVCAAGFNAIRISRMAGYVCSSHVVIHTKRSKQMEPLLLPFPQQQPNQPTHAPPPFSNHSLKTPTSPSPNPGSPLPYLATSIPTRLPLVAKALAPGLWPGPSVMSCWARMASFLVGSAQKSLSMASSWPSRTAVGVLWRLMMAVARVWVAIMVATSSVLLGWWAIVYFVVVGGVFWVCDVEGLRSDG